MAGGKQKNLKVTSHNLKDQEFPSYDRIVKATYASLGELLTEINTSIKSKDIAADTQASLEKLSENLSIYIKRKDADQTSDVLSDIYKVVDDKKNDKTTTPAEKAALTTLGDHIENARRANDISRMWLASIDNLYEFEKRERATPEFKKKYTEEEQKKIQTSFNKIIKTEGGVEKIDLPFAKTLIEKATKDQEKVNEEITQPFKIKDNRDEKKSGAESTWYSIENPGSNPIEAARSLVAQIINPPKNSNEITIKGGTPEQREAAVMEAVGGGSKEGKGEKDSGVLKYVTVHVGGNSPGKKDESLSNILAQRPNKHGDSTDPFGFRGWFPKIKDSQDQQRFLKMMIHSEKLDYLVKAEEQNQILPIFKGLLNPDLANDVFAGLKTYHSSKKQKEINKYLKNLSNESKCKLLASCTQLTADNWNNPKKETPEIKEQMQAYTRFFRALGHKKIDSNASALNHFIRSLPLTDLKYLSYFSDGQLRLLAPSTQYLLNHIEHCPDNVIRLIRGQSEKDMTTFLQQFAAPKTEKPSLAGLTEAQGSQNKLKGHILEGGNKDLLKTILSNREHKEVADWFKTLTPNDQTEIFALLTEAQREEIIPRALWTDKAEKNYHINQKFVEWFTQLPENNQTRVLESLDKTNSGELYTAAMKEFKSKGNTTSEHKLGISYIKSQIKTYKNNISDTKVAVEKVKEVVENFLKTNPSLEDQKVIIKSLKENGILVETLLKLGTATLENFAQDGLFDEEILKDVIQAIEKWIIDKNLSYDAGNKQTIKENLKIILEKHFNKPLGQIYSGTNRLLADSIKEILLPIRLAQISKQTDIKEKYKLIRELNEEFKLSEQGGVILKEVLDYIRSPSSNPTFTAVKEERFATLVTQLIGNTGDKVGQLYRQLHKDYPGLIGKADAILRDKVDQLSSGDLQGMFDIKHEEEFFNKLDPTKLNPTSQITMYQKMTREQKKVFKSGAVFKTWYAALGVNLQQQVKNSEIEQLHKDGGVPSDFKEYLEVGVFDLLSDGNKGKLYSHLDGDMLLSLLKKKETDADLPSIIISMSNSDALWKALIASVKNDGIGLTKLLIIKNGLGQGFILTSIINTAQKSTLNNEGKLALKLLLEGASEPERENIHKNAKTASKPVIDAIIKEIRTERLIETISTKSGEKDKKQVILDHKNTKASPNINVVLNYLITKINAVNPGDATASIDTLQLTSFVHYLIDFDLDAQAGAHSWTRSQMSAFGDFRKRITNKEMADKIDQIAAQYSMSKIADLYTNEKKQNDLLIGLRNTNLQSHAFANEATNLTKGDYCLRLLVKNELLNGDIRNFLILSTTHNVNKIVNDIITEETPELMKDPKVSYKQKTKLMENVRACDNKVQKELFDVEKKDTKYGKEVAQITSPKLGTHIWRTIKDHLPTFEDSPPTSTTGPGAGP